MSGCSFVDLKGDYAEEMQTFIQIMSPLYVAWAMTYSVILLQKISVEKKSNIFFKKCKSSFGL